MARGARKPPEELSALAQLLLRLRARKGLTQKAAAASLGITQSAVSRYEGDALVPDADTAAAMARFYGATPAEERELIRLVKVLEPRLEDSRLVMQRGNNLHLQRRIRELEKDCRAVRAYQPGMVLGQLQTPEYARAVFTQPRASRPKSSASPDALTVERNDRYRQLVEDTGRRWTLILTEGALNWATGSPQIMVDQMDRIAAASRLGHVRVGIIPARTFSPVFANHGFHLYDRRGVILATRNATALSTDPRDVAEYEDLFGHLESVAVWQDEARAVLEQVAGAYRSLV